MALPRGLAAFSATFASLLRRCAGLVLILATLICIRLWRDLGAAMLPVRSVRRFVMRIVLLSACTTALFLAMLVSSVWASLDLY